MATKYPYKARANSLLSIQLYRSSSGSIDLMMTSNMDDDTDFLFHSNFNAKRHGLFAAEFIKEHADGKTFLWLIDFLRTITEKFKEQPTTSIRLINSEVLSVLDELEKASEQFATNVDDETLEYESQVFVPLSAIQTLRERYR